MSWTVEVNGGVVRADPVKVALVTLSDKAKTGTLFVGPIGSGKTHCVLEVTQWLSSSAKLSNRTTVLSAAWQSRRDMRGILQSSMKNKARAERCVVAADDMDLWSPRMLHLLADAVDLHAVQLVGAVRSGSLERVLEHFRPAASPVLVDLKPWRSTELSAYARSTSGMPLHPVTCAAMVEFAGGNPLCLVELLEQGRVSDQLRRRHETWCWTEAMTVPYITLSRVRRRLNDVAPGLVDVLCTLGVCGPVPLGVLSRLHATSALQAAEEQKLVVAHARGGRVDIGLRCPLEGRVAVAAAPVLRLRELVAKALDAVIAEGETETAAAAAAAEFGMRLQLLIPEPVGVAAGIAAMRNHSPSLAEVLVAEHSSDRALELRFTALVEQGRFQEAANLTGDGAANGKIDKVLGLAVAWPLHIPPRQTADMSSLQNKPPVGEEVEILCANAWSGQLLPEVLQHGRLLAASGLDGPNRLACITATTWAALQLGRIEDGLQISKPVHLNWDSSVLSATELLLSAAVGLCLLVRGSIKESRSLAGRLCRVGVSEQWHLAYAMGAFLAGRCALVEARPALALRRLSEAEASLSVAAATVDQGPILQSLGVAYVLSGQTADAAPFGGERQHDEASVVGPRFGVHLADLARVDLLHVQGHRRAALNLAGQIVQRSSAEGITVVELLGWHAVARIQPSSEAAQQLASIAGRTDFALASTYAEQAAAAHAGDRPALQNIAEHYERLGLRWLAAETAASALAGADRAELTAGWAVRAKRILGPLQLDEQLVAPEWWGVASERVAPLTTREEEIAEAVLSGETSTQIATRLHLSRRTVENHLQHVFRKVGVSRREDLALALRAATFRRNGQPAVDVPNPADD